jgi:hypothetical protein
MASTATGRDAARGMAASRWQCSKTPIMPRVTAGGSMSSLGRPRKCRQGILALILATPDTRSSGPLQTASLAHAPADPSLDTRRKPPPCSEGDGAGAWRHREVKSMTRVSAKTTMPRSPVLRSDACPAQRKHAGHRRRARHDPDVTDDGVRPAPTSTWAIASAPAPPSARRSRRR